MNNKGFINIIIAVIIVAALVGAVGYFVFVQSPQSPTDEEISQSPPPTAISATKVISPNGGETWKLGTKYSIRWSGGKPTDQVGIDLLDAAGKVVGYLPGDTWPNNGEFSWDLKLDSGYIDVPRKFVAPGKYKIKVRTISAASSDESDSFFTIVSTQLLQDNDSFIRVLSPNGGEPWKLGEKHRIEWTEDTYSLPGESRGDYEFYLDKFEGGVFKTIRRISIGIDEQRNYIREGSKYYTNWLVELYDPPQELSPGEYYIRVKLTPANIEDRSDRPFTVMSAQ